MIIISQQKCIKTVYIYIFYFQQQMMLGLATHEPHFSLLREEVKFGGKNSQKRYVKNIS